MSTADTATPNEMTGVERRTSPEAGRRLAPVFVLGCGRSGTKLLYHTLLSAGGFAVYHAESNAFNLLGLRFGNLRRRKNREKLLNAWLRSKLFHRSGLQPEEIAPQVLENCGNAADFLRILMTTIARKQGVERWAESTPLHTLYLPLIKKLIPDALVIHIIRDGRDVAVSLRKIGWIRPFPWDRKRGLVTAGLFWKWIVTKGRKYGRAMSGDYIEIHYEDLATRPREVLAKLSTFLGQDLDYDRIQNAALGSLQNPNSSFKDNSELANPVGRWTTVLSSDEVRDLESAIGDLLQQTGYPLATAPDPPKTTFAIRVMRVLYPAFYDLKLWLKSNTPLGRTASIIRMGIVEPGDGA